MTRAGSILVIEDEEIMREILEALLTPEGYEVRLARDGEAGLELARAMPFDAAIVDVMMPGMDGLSVLDELKKIDDDLAVVMVTAYASVDTAVDAMKRGALRESSRALRTGGYLGFLVDQSAGRHGVFADFFGRPASTTGAPATLALKYDVPLIPASQRRLPGEHRLALCHRRRPDRRWRVARRTSSPAYRCV